MTGIRPTITVVHIIGRWLRSTKGKMDSKTHDDGESQESAYTPAAAADDDEVQYRKIQDASL